ncbi:MAG: cytochrome c oxidase accessory protein CcoG [Marinilabiliales bacterium]|nr:MAG: cytochrome c oxidase accessory protein CcoG [Marinilabiliales bacterium]
MKSKGEKEYSYRDRIATVDEHGKRNWVYAKKPKGDLFNKRRIVATILLLILFIGPYIKYKGDPIMLFNILERKFILFGVIFWPQDFHLILLSVITLIVFVVLFTVIFGRLFCGWVCPQTIFMEFIFRRIEYFIEGDAAAQKRLHKQEWNFDKIRKKTLKHIIFFAIAVITSTTFLSYIIGADQVLEFYKQGPLIQTGGFTALIIFSAAFYFVFAFFREQVCTIACPYGRLQGVLVDRKTIIVAYDYKRGEPRGPLKLAKEKGYGDCIACNSCVAVCPTGIDIKNGTQLECINCTACIDACNAVMDRSGRPRGLIRYDSEEGISTGKRSIFNTRSIAYSAVLTVLLFFVASMFMIRGDFEVTILRQRGTMFQEYGNDSLSNIYNYQIVNKIRQDIEVQLKPINVNGKIRYIGPKEIIKKGEVGKGTFMLILPKNQIKSSNTKIIFGVYSEGKLIEEYNSTFVGPNNLD